MKELNSLSHLLDVAAKDWGIALPANPAKMVRRPQVARGRDRRLLPGEESNLFAACSASRARMLAPAVRFAIETAMRMGEILSLTWRNVDIGRMIAESEFVELLTPGSLVTPGSGGSVFIPAGKGFTVFQVRP